MARKKKSKKSKRLASALSNKEILRQLRANAYALLGLQIANAKGHEQKYDVLAGKEREQVKTELREKFYGLRPDQERKLTKKRTRRRKSRTPSYKSASTIDPVSAPIRRISN